MKILNNKVQSIKISIYLVLFFVVAIFASAETTFATDLQSASTQVEQSHEKLLQVNDNTTLSPEEKLQKEIAARVNIVNNALSLSLQEISNLNDNLNKLPQFTVDSREDILRQGFVAELKKSQDYYISKQEEAGKTIFTLESIKNFAGEIVDYRNTIYNPKTAEIVDFTLLFYNEETIATAKIRLEKIASNIKTLEKLTILKPGYFQAKLDQSAILLNESETLGLQAKALILAEPEVSVEPILSATETIISPQSDPSQPTLESDIVVEPIPTANELLIKGLENIKSAYEIFVQIGKDTKKILGIR